MIKKVSHKEFETFKQEVSSCLKGLGIKRWTIDFEFKRLHQKNACLIFDWDNRMATFQLSTVISTDRSVVYCARHEAGHFLTAQALCILVPKLSRVKKKELIGASELIANLYAKNIG